MTLDRYSHVLAEGQEHAAAAIDALLGRWMGLVPQRRYNIHRHHEQSRRSRKSFRGGRIRTGDLLLPKASRRCSVSFGPAGLS